MDRVLVHQERGAGSAPRLDLIPAGLVNTYYYTLRGTLLMRSVRWLAPVSCLGHLVEVPLVIRSYGRDQCFPRRWVMGTRCLSQVTESGRTIPTKRITYSISGMSLKA